MDFSISKKITSFGLGIGSDSMRIMELHRHKDSISVRGFSDIALPKGLVVNDTVSDAKTFNYLLKQALDKPQFGRIGTNYVTVSLPESKSFVRVIQIPKMSDSEAENAIPFEAESFIPLPIDQVYMDWERISDDGDKMNILIIASPKEMVDKYLTVLDQAGLKTTALEVESQSCLRVAKNNPEKETFLIMDIHAHRSSLIMVEDGNLQFTSTVPIAGSSFTESIAKSLGVSSVKAEEIKKRVGMVNTADYPNIKIALLPVLNNLAEEIRNVLKFHNEHSQKQVGKILLTGGGAKLRNLPEFLQSQLGEGGMKIEVVNPWQNLDKTENLPMNSYEALGYTTAIGLAMRGIGKI